MQQKYISSYDFLSKHKAKEGKALVVGSKCYGDKPDRRTLYSSAVGVDLEQGPGVDFTHDLEYPIPEKHGKFDHVDCASVLEHCERPWKMCENIEDSMVEGGTIFLQVPFVWRVHNYPGDYWRFTIDSFKILFPNIKWETRGYMMEDRYKHATISLMSNGNRFLQRAEAVGFGVKCTIS